MNVKKISLCGVIAALSISVAAASPHGTRSASTSHTSIGRPAISSGGGRNLSSTSRFVGNQHRFTPRVTTGTSGFSGNRNWSGSNWSGSNHHHHHRGGNLVFFGGFGYPYWYDYYPYPYGYNDYGQSAYYDDGAGYDGSSIADLQERLAQAGYYHGAIDGIMGSATRRALRAYERDNGSRAYRRY